MILNKRGIALYYSLFVLALFFGGCDSNSLKMFLISKLVCVVILLVMFKLYKYLPKNYK